MLTTVLFDLDDTLLDNPIDRFLPAYLHSLGEHMAHRFDPANLSSALRAGTQAMLENEDPERTLRSAFESVFFPMLGAEPDSLRANFDVYYRDRFPGLQSLTAPVAGARDRVDAAFRRQMSVVIATNPLFPIAAVRQRLHWAGLDPAAYPFDLITSYECMHFAKPRPEYVAEVLAITGAQPQEALFVGNDEVEDLAPARALGLADCLAGAGKESGWMKFDALLNRNGDTGEAPPPDHALPQILRGNLAAAAHMLRSSGWCDPPLEEGWGPKEIACHLRDYEQEILQPRLQAGLREENPYLSAVESDRWAEERGYSRQDGEQAVKDFASSRRETIRMLEGITEEAYRRPVRHAVFGPTTLAEQIRFAVRHDLLHIAQLRASIASCRGG